MSVAPRALLIASAIGTVLQTAMVVAGVVYAVLARGGTTGSAVFGGVLAGAVCALIGIAVSYALHDVPASLLALGTLSSAVTGALGGWLGSRFIA
jgi:hypothetical protein